MEEPIDKCLWIDIEIFTTTVHRDVIVCKLDFIFRSFEGIDHELFLESALEENLPMESIYVPRIKAQIDKIRESMIKEGSSSVDWRNSFHNLKVPVAIKVLRKIDKIGRSIVINGNIDSWHLIEAHIVIPNSKN